MPRTVPRYTEVVSSAVTEEVYHRLSDDSQMLGISLSALVRMIVEDHYKSPRSQFYTSWLSGEEVLALKQKGYFLVADD